VQVPPQPLGKKVERTREDPERKKTAGKTERRARPARSSRGSNKKKGKKRTGN